MIQWLYDQLMRLLLPYALLRWYRRARHEPLYRSCIGERLGWYGQGNSVHEFESRPVWVHAVSLGETQAAQPLVEALLVRGLPVVLTHGTATGRAAGARCFASALTQGQLRQLWLPYDTPGAVQRFLRVWQPRCGLLIETEVWPNLVRGCARDRIALVLVSARLSERSLQRILRAGNWARKLYQKLNAVLAQTADDAARFKRLEVRAPQVVGNLKFDVPLREELRDAGLQWRAALRRPVIAVVNTREGEEALLLAALERVSLPDHALLLLVPRHPPRFAEVRSLLQASGRTFISRTDGGMPQDSHQIWLGDSVGEMDFYYALSDMAILGGSFQPLGGHNLIEACRQGVPVIVGPHTYNFAQAVSDALALNAAVSVADLQAALIQAAVWLKAPNELHDRQQAAHAYAKLHQGATIRILALIEPYLAEPSSTNEFVR